MNVLFRCSAWLLSATAGHALAAPIDHWCKADERVVFACHAGTKTVSMCARGDLAGSGGVLSYRFGKLDSPLELEVSAVGSAMKKVFSYENTVRTSGFARLIRFKRGPINYVIGHVVDRDEKNRANDVVAATVVVLLPAKVARIECDEASAIDRMPAEMDGKGFTRW